MDYQKQCGKLHKATQNTANIQYSFTQIIDPYKYPFKSFRLSSQVIFSLPMIIFKNVCAVVIYFNFLEDHSLSYIIIIPMKGRDDNILASSPQLLRAIVACLTQLLPEAAPTDTPSAFDLRSNPTISVSNYLARMFKYMNCSLGIFVYALVLLDRAQEYSPSLRLHGRNIHRLLLASSVVAAKYIDDFFYKNTFYANVGGVNLTTLNTLQLDFLKLIDFNCHIPEDAFQSYLEKLEMFAEANERKEENEEERVERAVMVVGRKEGQTGDCQVREASAAKVGKENLGRVEVDCGTSVKE